MNNAVYLKILMNPKILLKFCWISKRGAIKKENKEKKISGLKNHLNFYKIYQLKNKKISTIGMYCLLVAMV